MGYSKNYFVVLLESDFVVSDEDGVELDEDDGVLLEPDAAEPLGVELELDGLVLDDDEDEPPLALSFLFRSIEVEDELEPEGDVLGAAVVPLADEDEEPGVVVAPEGEVEDELDERSAPRSHAVISVAPSARETATAIVDILMGPPWLGYWNTGANIGPRLLNHHRDVWVSSLSSAACRSIGDLYRPRSTESRDSGRHASGRLAPASGWSLRADQT